MNHDYLSDIFETCHLAQPIAGDIEGSYPWRRCGGPTCAHRIQGTSRCICLEADWTHFLLVEGLATSTSSQLDELANNYDHLRALLPHAELALAYTTVGSRVVVLVAAPRSAQLQVYRSLRAHVDATGNLDNFGSDPTSWTVL